MNPRVSILIPTFNQVKYVEEAVTSAIAQTYDNLQVVVADDASTDGTQERLRNLAAMNPDRMRLVVGKRNLGITGNCNRGLAACDGDFIGMQGGDDILLPRKVEAQVDWFRERPDGVLCYHDCEIFDSDSGEVICKFSELGSFSSGSGPARIIRTMRFSAAVCVMVKADKIPDSGFDRRLSMVSDWKLQIDVLSDGSEYGYVDGVLARYRRHSSNSRKTFPVKYYQDCLFTLAIVETEMMGYAREARLARSRIIGLMSIDYLVSGKCREGLLLGASSLRVGIFSWKFPLLLLFFVLPKTVQKKIRERLAGRVRALNYLGA